MMRFVAFDLVDVVLSMTISLYVPGSTTIRLLFLAFETADMMEVNQVFFVTLCTGNFVPTLKIPVDHADLLYPESMACTPHVYVLVLSPRRTRFVNKVSLQGRTVQLFGG